MKRMTCKAKCLNTTGSEMRSASAPMESGYALFEINGVKYKMFYTSKLTECDFKHGKEYDISFLPKKRGYLSYPKLVA